MSILKGCQRQSRSGPAATLTNSAANAGLLIQLNATVFAQSNPTVAIV